MPSRTALTARVALVALPAAAMALAPLASASSEPPRLPPLDAATGLLDADPDRGAPGTALRPAQSQPGSPQGQAGGSALRGTFGIAAGQCEGGAPDSGSWFRMQTSNGDFFTNNSSPCGDRTYTPLAPGQDGGLRTTNYQPHPSPPFAGPGGSSGSALADRIIQPQEFFGFDFSVATQEQDPQTGEGVPVPVISAEGSTLTGDLRAWAVGWNGQHFNQGAPKPDGSTPGPTELPAGTYDASTGAYSLQWQSLIVGGPFNGNTGIWHLEGTFQPSGGQSGGESTATTGGTQPAAAGSAGDPEGAQAAGEGPESTGRTSTSPGAGRLPRTGGAPLATLAPLLVLGLAAVTRQAAHRSG